MHPEPKPSRPNDQSEPPANKPIILATLLLTVIALVQLWILTAGTFHVWPGYTTYTRQLADAFAHGQLSLRKLPSPALLALPDPYDPRTNNGLRLHDAVLFDGKYYLYWGPAPAILIAAACRAIGAPVPQFGDQHLVFPFLFGTLLFATILIFLARAKLFPAQPLWTTAIPIVSLGLGTPMLFTLARPAIYEAAICGGQFFLMAGILAAWLGLSAPRPRLFPLLLAGICLALSVGSRVSLAPAATAVICLGVWRAWQLRAAGQWILPAAALALPVLTGAALLAWYNQTRFHSITEFGLNYQLAFRNQHAKQSEFSSPWYIPLNLYRYLFTSPTLLRSFPYFWARSGAPPIAASFNLPASFGFESVIGILWGQTFLLLSLLAMAAPWWRRMKPVSATLPDHALLLWLSLTLTAAALLGFAPSLTIEGSTMRYLLDTVPCLTVLAAIGFWWMTSHLTPASRRVFVGIIIFFVVAESFMGLCLGTQGYYAHFAQFNRGLYIWMQTTFPTF